MWGCHSALRPGCTVALSVPNDKIGTDELIFIAEVYFLLLLFMLFFNVFLSSLLKLVFFILTFPQIYRFEILPLNLRYWTTLQRQ